MQQLSHYTVPAEYAGKYPATSGTSRSRILKKLLRYIRDICLEANLSCSQPWVCLEPGL